MVAGLARQAGPRAPARGARGRTRLPVSGTNTLPSAGTLTRAAAAKGQRVRGRRRRSGTRRVQGRRGAEARRPSWAPAPQPLIMGAHHQAEPPSAVRPRWRGSARGPAGRQGRGHAAENPASPRAARVRHASRSARGKVHGAHAACRARPASGPGNSPARAGTGRPCQRRAALQPATTTLSPRPPGPRSPRADEPAWNHRAMLPRRLTTVPASARARRGYGETDADARRLTSLCPWSSRPPRDHREIEARSPGAEAQAVPVHPCRDTTIRPERAARGSRGKNQGPATSAAARRRSQTRTNEAWSRRRDVDQSRPHGPRAGRAAPGRR